MNLNLNTQIATGYTNNSQVARVLTEDWVQHNSYCPICGNPTVSQFENNKPVADFFCDSCHEEFELKSKNSKSLGTKINDGAYSPMIERINASNNPNFFFLTYEKKNWTVSNFMIVPKHYFVTDIIEQRKPLAETARRAGWVGCNIEISKIPQNGRIYLVRDSSVIEPEEVIAKWQRTSFLNQKKGDSKGWILDIMNCVDSIENETFSLKEVYAFEDELQRKYTANHFIKDKIRQQLQVLRDQGLIEFKSRGVYRKIER